MNTYSSSPTPRPIYTDEFKHNAIQQLNAGKSLRKVSVLLGISKNSLLRWKNQAKFSNQMPVSSENSAKDGYQDVVSVYDKKSPLVEDPQPMNPSTRSSDPSITNENSGSPSQESELIGTSTGDNVHSETIKEEALRLLHAGQSIDQVAVLLQVPKNVVYRWRHNSRLSSQPIDSTDQMTDRRRLYNDVFREEALQQIHSGISVRQVSQNFGVSEVTLHKWRKEAQYRGRESNERPIDTIDELREKLRELEEERDVLKKALLILLRPS